MDFGQIFRGSQKSILPDGDWNNEDGKRGKFSKKNCRIKVFKQRITAETVIIQ